MSERDESPSKKLAETIYADLKRRILRGELRPGSRLQPERELAVSYGTNRNTLREAVRRLEEGRLVAVRHGQGVTVSDFRRTGDLSLVTEFLEAQPTPSEAVLLLSDILEPRTWLLSHAAIMAARRADQKDLQRLNDIAELVIAAFAAQDVPVLARGFERFIDALIDAGHSLALRWIANPMIDAFRQALERFPELWVLDPAFPNHLRKLVLALSDGDEKQAALCVKDYYDKIDVSFLKALTVLQSFAETSQQSKIDAAGTSSSANENHHFGSNIDPQTLTVDPKNLSTKQTKRNGPLSKKSETNNSGASQSEANNSGAMPTELEALPFIDDNSSELRH